MPTPPILTFRQLYQGHASAVHRFAFALTQDAAEADDLTAETFVRAFAVSGPIHLPTARAYLYAVVRNLRRRGWRRTRREAPLGAAGHARDPAPTPEAAAATRESVRDTMRALAQLPERDRTALLMRGHDEMSHEEIAAALNVSVGAAKVCIHRARLRLAALLGTPFPCHPKAST